MKGTLPRQSTSRKPGAARKSGPARRPGPAPRRQSTSRKPPAPRTAATARTPNASRRPTRRAVLLVTGVCVVLAALVATGVTMLLPHRTNDVASLDGRPVTRDELLFHMRRLAPTVQNELRTTYHLRGAFGWNAKAGDRTALQRLETSAFDEIRRDRATLVLAKQQGLVSSVDYSGFLAELAKENQSRAHAIATGQTVYGVAKFSPEEYYTHRLTELTTSLQERLSAGAHDPLQVTDADVRHAFDADPGAWSAGATTYRYSQLVVPVPAGASADFATRLRQRVTGAGRLAAVAAQVSGARLTTGTYDGGSSTGVNPHDQGLLAALQPLKPGRISAPVTDPGQITYYQLDGKKVDEDKAFADYRRRIRQSLVEEKFHQYLQRRIDSSDLKVDTSAVDAINAEEVHQ
ncbi:peptidyl-prolyl cis-trans isomerase [Streptomyces sp. NPDC006332]|uniref:peptidyl-prolyl cis-trans isomerase n=1 Tax=Streptomyces sp. NPDC006332 TaxID=3155456 RepID=UPI0033B58722